LPAKQKGSLKAVAMFMGSTQGNILKTLRLGPNPEAAALESVNWRGGRKYKKRSISKE